MNGRSLYRCFLRSVMYCCVLTTVLVTAGCARRSDTVDCRAMLSVSDREWLERRPKANAVPAYEFLIAEIGYGGLLDRDLSTTEVAAVVGAAENGRFAVDRADDRNIVYRNAVWFTMLLGQLMRMGSMSQSKDDLDSIRHAMLGVVGHMDSPDYRGFGNGVLEQRVLAAYRAYFDFLLDSYDAKELHSLGYDRLVLVEHGQVLLQAQRQIQGDEHVQ